MRRRARLRRRSPSWGSPRNGYEDFDSPRRFLDREPLRSRSPPRRRRRRRRVRRDSRSAESFDSRPSRGRDPQETEARIWILHSDAAKVIGRNGRALRDVESRTGTRIQVSKEEDMNPETKERSVDIIGLPRDQDDAVLLIVEKVLYCRQDDGEIIKDARTSGEQQEAQKVITVLPEEVGKVLGRKGETVRIIEKDSGAKVELNKAEGKVEIFGKKEDQEKALELLLQEVHYAKDSEGNVLKDEPRPTKRTETETAALPVMKLWVKDKEAGKVIGRGGETVREVMEKSSADIKVQKADEMAPGSKERLIRLIGSKEQQEAALQLILEEVTWARGLEGMLKGDATGAEAEKPPEEEKGEEPEEKLPPRRFRETERERNAPKSGPARWVCATCGGDHRTKNCPHAPGILGVGVQMGMQMGLQAMGLPGGGMPMGMPPMGMPPMGMPFLPGMKMPGMEDSSGSSSSSSEEVMEDERPRRRRVRRTARRRREPHGDPEPPMPQKKKIVMSDL